MDRDDAPHAAAPFAVGPRVIGGRYGLSSKEMTPSMIKPIFEELAAARPKRHFTVGIYDDVTHLSLPIDGGFRYARPAGEVQAVFFGLGSDGTVGANKASVKIIGESTDLFAQGYFVYDSKKSGSVTVSHLRFGPEPIRSTYLVEDADFVACHQFGLLGKTKVLEYAKPGATFLLNAPYGPDEVWDHLPGAVQQMLIDKRIDFWVIDAVAVATEAGMGNRINTVMQPCFFQLAGILPAEEAVTRIKDFVKKTYAKRGDAVVQRNYAAIDQSLASLGHVTLAPVSNHLPAIPPMPGDVPDFVAAVTARLMAGEGDLLPVSALPVDGTFPSGTTRYEKRGIAQLIPVWDQAICIDCGKCAMVCPHATIRMKVFPESAVADAPANFVHKEFKSRDLVGHRLTIQVAPDDCTGCGVCVDVCPAKSKTDVSHKAINMEPILEHRDVERERWDFFQSIPLLDRSLIAHDTIKGSQVLEPLFEFSGACGGCGETPVHPAGQPAVRRPDDRGQRHRLLVDLRRQPADHAVDRQRQPDAARPGTTRCSRTTPSSGSGCASRSTPRPTRPGCCSSGCRPSSATDLVRGAASTPARTPNPRSSSSGRGSARSAKPLAGIDGRACRRRPAAAGARRRPRPQGRLDHRRRRLGLRHRLRRPRPRPELGPQRQHPGARHRGVLEHRRPGLEVDAARRRRQVRGGGQGHRQEGPRRDRPLVRQRLRRAGLDGRQRPPDDQGAAARPTPGRDRR